MGGKVSSEMLQARQLILQGHTPYSAAKNCNLTTGAITRSAWFRQHIQEPIEQACELIRKGKTVAFAAKKCKISPALIRCSDEYKLLKENA